MGGITKPRPETRLIANRIWGSSALPLCLRDLSALDAAGANTEALGCAIHQSFHFLQIHVPAPSGYVVRVGDIIAELRPLAANIAYLCHRFAPSPMGVS